MANFASIAAVGMSIVRVLNHCFEQEQPVEPTDSDMDGDLDPVRAVLVRTTDFEEGVRPTSIGERALTVYLYRVDLNKTMRAAWSAVGSQDGLARLALDLHYLLSPWAPTAEEEHRILGRALQCLETNPVFSGPMLHPSGGWAPNDSLQMVMQEISTEAVMRTFDSLPTDYRLSVPYVARVVRLDAAEATPAPEVVTAVTGVEVLP